MINTQQIAGILSKPIEKTEVKKALAKQLIQLSGDDFNKNTTLHDIFTTLMTTSSDEYLIDIINNLAHKEYYNYLSSMWLFQQSCYNTAYQYNNHTYSTIKQFAKDNLDDYCDFILLNQKLLPTYFAKDIRQLLMMSECVLNNYLLKLDNIKQKTVVDNVFHWGIQFNQITNSNYAFLDFLINQGKNYQCQLNLNCLTAFWHRANSNSYDGNNFETMIMDTYGDIFPFTFTVNSQHDIDDLINYMLKDEDFRKECTILIQETKAKIVVNGYEDTLSKWLNIANNHSKNKMYQKITKFINQVFMYYN